MTRHEELQDKYEDALFALFMDDIATALGKEAEEENERLKNDPDFVIPKDVDRRCLQTIRRHFGKQRAYAAGHFALKTMKQVAMVAGIAALLFIGAFAVSESVRLNTLNLMIEVFDTHTEFRFKNGPDAAIPEIDVGWLPEDFTLERQEYDGIYAWCFYRKSENVSIDINYTSTTGAGFSIDTEDADVEYIGIQGSQAMLIKKGNEIQIAWAAKDNTLFVILIGTGVGREDLIHVANELKY